MTAFQKAEALAGQRYDRDTKGIIANHYHRVANLIRLPPTHAGKAKAEAVNYISRFPNLQVVTLREKTNAY